MRRRKLQNLRHCIPANVLDFGYFILLMFWISMKKRRKNYILFFFSLVRQHNRGKNCIFIFLLFLCYQPDH